MRTWLLFLATAGPLLAAPQPGDPGTPEYAKAAELVKQLGHARFAVREAAGKDLIEMGGTAAAALREGLRSPDEEVRTRCRALLPKALAADWQRRADAFLADTEGKQKHDLPLLADFEKVVGGTAKEPPVRELFAELVRSNGEFLARLVADPKEAKVAVRERARVVHDQARVGDKQVAATLGDLAAVLFADLHVRPAWDGEDVTARLIANPGLVMALTREGTGPALRRLVAKWGEVRCGTGTINVGVVAAFIELVGEKPFVEAAPALATIARGTKFDAGLPRVPAVHALAKIDTPEARQALDELVGDKSTLVSHKGIEYRIGDSALAAAVTRDGLTAKQVGVPDPLTISYVAQDGAAFKVQRVSLHGFSSDADRTKAVQKWKAATAKKK